jgi:hypothetical protein
VLGIAGAARAMTPEAMRAELDPSPRCSARSARACCTTRPARPSTARRTSAASARPSARCAPHVGNAVDRHRRRPAQPGRYCLFGNLFAGGRQRRRGHRIDRHPTMSRHPVTPMHEADLRPHLAAQGLARRALGIAYTATSQDGEALDSQLQHAAWPQARRRAVRRGRRRPPRAIGVVLWATRATQNLLAVGPSSVVEAWPRTGRPAHEPAPPRGTRAATTKAPCSCWPAACRP